jgi:hypothetical protein
MGRQRDYKMVGTVGNLIFYNHQGDYRIRTKPVSVKRSGASINSGLNFGKSSKISKQIRNGIASINPLTSDSRTIYRFTGAWNKFISWSEKQDPGSPVRQNGLPFIQGFQFNEQSDLDSIRAIQVSINSPETGLIEIRFAPFVPGGALQAPFNTDHIVLKWVITSTSLADVETEKLGKGEISIPYVYEVNQPPTVSIPVIATKPERIILMILAVHYMVKKKNGIQLLSDLKKLPCGVLWAGRVK